VEALAANLDTVPGAHMVYSDLGAIVLATIIEKQYGKRIDALFAERVTGPLGFSRMRFLPPREWRTEIRVHRD